MGVCLHNERVLIEDKGALSVLANSKKIECENKIKHY